MERYTKIEYRETKEKSISDHQTQFTVQPLERGLGNTLGTALRRTLLSSVSGVAPFAIRIRDVQHEFQTIEGVVEDVTKIILNVRQLNFSYNPEIIHDGKIVKITFKADRKGDQLYTAQDLNLDAAGGINIVNPEAEIATSGLNKLEFELFLTCGRGYRSFEENKAIVLQESAELVASSNVYSTSKIIAVDSDFSPIKRVQVQVNELNSASSKIEEKLTIDIITDKTVKAKDALSQVAQILIAHLQVIGDVDNLENLDVFETQKDSIHDRFNNSLDISELNLTIRSSNALKRSDLNKVADLVKLTHEDLKQIRNLGQKSIKEIIDKLAEHGLELQKGE